MQKKNALQTFSNDICKISSLNEEKNSNFFSIIFVDNLKYFAITNTKLIIYVYKSPGEKKIINEI